MIYYYKVRVEFIKGRERILKDYMVDFREIAKLIIFLETKHKDNYKLISIKERRKNDYNGIQFHKL